jgi:hypothetical protein
MEMKLETLLPYMLDCGFLMLVIAFIIIFSCYYVFFSAVRFHYTRNKNQSKGSFSCFMNAIKLARKETKFCLLPVDEESEFVKYAMQKPPLREALKLPATLFVILGGLCLYLLILSILFIYQIQQIIQ